MCQQLKNKEGLDMYSRNHHDKWSAELVKIIKLENILKAFEADVASCEQENHPFLTITKHEKVVNQIASLIKNFTGVYPYSDGCLSAINQRIFNCNEIIERIQSKHKIAEEITNKLLKQHMKVLKRATNYYTNKDRNASFHKNSFSQFENTIYAQQRTWQNICNALEELSHLADYSHTQHNVLSLILTPSHEAFINLINEGKIPLGSEIGYIALQRLVDISRSTQSGRHMKAVANRTIRQLMSFGWPESLIRFNTIGLYNEIYKLVLHSLLHPDKKVIWLGTARAVETFVKNFPGEGTYINPANEVFSWELNRAWLQAAVELRYEFKLVEQHFPDVECAILSGNPANLIEQLAREIRPHGVATSQYNGYDSPTATPQEILVLMNMGCYATKNPNDGSVTIHPPKLPRALEDEKNKRVLTLKRHSSPNLFKSAPPPPLDQRSDQFTDPALSNHSRTIFTAANAACPKPF